jgi:Spy/CpxP family protein refolding chaperone
MSLFRSLVLTLVLSGIGAGMGAWGGAQYVLHRMHRPTPLHELVHEKLHLSADQDRRIAGMERDHAARRQALEAEMRAANAELARAFQEQHADTPQVEAAIDRFHRAMGALQKETIVHVLAMRSVLTPEQTTRFDDTVVRSLTEDPQ